jgi:hypothetical protein
MELLRRPANITAERILADPEESCDTPVQGARRRRVAEEFRIRERGPDR